MKLVTVTQMREWERIATEDFAVPSLLLMENAAACVISAIEAEVGCLFGKQIHVFCGKGNNGGDGFAIARMAHNQNAQVVITPLFDENDAKGDAKQNLDMTKKLGIPFVSASTCQNCDIIVEAIFGTGFHGEVAGDAKTAIEAINKSPAFVVSVDVPGGVDADTGKASATAVFADLCVTFSAVKPGHLLFPGKNHYQKLIKTDISIPRQVINAYSGGYDMIDQTAFSRIPKRTPDSHKGNYGKALAFVGSCGMSGAAILSSTAILKSGAGMATAAVPASIQEICASHFKAVMTCKLPEENGTLCENAANILLEKQAHQDVLLTGCGIGTTDGAKQVIHRLLTAWEKPMVLDADGINALADCPELLLSKKCPLILTPHVAEFARLLGCSVETVKENPLKLARDFALTYDVTLVLKDATTIVADKDGTLFLCPAANSGMATAGSGDVLSGIITGLLAQGASATDAAVCGVYLHACAGKIAKDTLGEYGMTAEDILSALPHAFKNPIDITPNIKEL